MPVIVERKADVSCGCVGFFVTSQLKFEENMKVNMNIIVGGTDDILDNILFATRTVRKEMKKLLKALR